LQELVNKKIADHNTYYNLAAINSRIGDCKKSIDYLNKAIEEDTHHAITRSYVLHDVDFASMSNSAKCEAEWGTILNKLH